MNRVVGSVAWPLKGTVKMMPGGIKASFDVLMALGSVVLQWTSFTLRLATRPGKPLDDAEVKWFLVISLEK